MKPSKTQVGGDHYKEMPIQPHYFCHVNKLGALESNVVKYICRHSRKGGKADLLKARHYIDLLLEWQYGDDGQTAPADTVAGMTTMHPLSVQEILAARQLIEVRRMASAGEPLITPLPPLKGDSRPALPGETWGAVAELPPGWPYAHSGVLDADLVGELTEHEVHQGLRPDHSPQPCAHNAGLVKGYCTDCDSQVACPKHSLMLCKVCNWPPQFPAGTSYGGTSD